MADEFSFKDWIVREKILEHLRWHGLPMKAEHFSIQKNLGEFLDHIQFLIPENSILIQNADGYQLSWLVNNVSYVLLIKDRSSGDSSQLEGILSSIILSRETAEKSRTPICQLNWLPDDAQLIFSMGDKVGGVNQARIDGYISSLNHSDVKTLVEHRLKLHGWVSLAQYPHRSAQGLSTIFEAFCGTQHVRIDLQKKSFQSRITVMSIEQ